MIRRLAALVLAALLIASHVAAVDCVGWQSSASDRMACCMKAEDGCQDQVLADQCCAAGELAQQPILTSSVAAVPTPAAVPAALLSFSHASSIVPIVPIVRSLSDHPQSPPHLRRTVLLI